MSVCIINSNAFCVEDITNIENYEKAVNDETQTYVCHHRLETHTSDGERRKVDISKEELIALDMYYHRPANELIYITMKEHISLHHRGKKISDEVKRKLTEAHKGVSPSNKGVPLSDEQKKELSEKLKGRLSPFKGKHHSEEAKRKISEAARNRSEETRKKLSEANKGHPAWNKGKHLSEEQKRHLSEINKGSNNPQYGKHWKLVDGKRIFY